MNNTFEGAETPREAIFMALGAVSVCWDSMKYAGVFDSTRAKEIGDELIELLSDEFGFEFERWE